MKKKLLFVLMTTMVLGTLLTGCKKEDAAEDAVSNSSSIEEAVEEETPEENSEEPETGNFEELQVEDEVELDVEEGQQGAGA